MKKNSVLVKKVLMSIVTAVVFAFGFTACTDDALDSPQAPNKAEQTGQSSSGEVLEAYGLTWHNFDKDDQNPIQILNADTTEISVSKKLADKLGITSFVGHPLGIWQDICQLPYARKATEETLVGDRYILKVTRATVAELIGEKQASLSTQVYVNDNEKNVQTRAAEDGIPTFAAKYVDEENTIHPSVIHLTDPYGYDNDYHTEEDVPDTKMTRAAESGNYRYLTADELACGNTRWSSSRRIISAHNTIKFDHDFEIDEASHDTLNFNAEIPIDFDLNYFITLNGGFSFSKGVYVKKFEAGLDGNFAFKPEAYLAFTKSFNIIPKEKQRRTLAEFNLYSFTFMVGPIPVVITCRPALFLKLKAGVEGSVRVGFRYEYANNFKGGIRYEDGRGWSTIKEFNEVANEFEWVKPEAVFSAEASAGFYLGVDVRIYDVAGPEAGVGPRLDLGAKMTVAPFADKKLDLEAEAKVSIDAFVGAKIKILGWELAEWSTDINLAGPWTLAKYPNDGNTDIHRSKKGAELAKLRSVWDEIIIQADAKDNKFRQLHDQAIEMYMLVNNCSETDALLKLYSIFEVKALGLKVINRDNLTSLYKMMNSEVNNWIDGLKDQYKVAFDRKCWEEVKENVIGAFDLSKFNQDDVSTYLDEGYDRFYKKYQRVPDMQKTDDMYEVLYAAGSKLPDTFIAGSGNVNMHEGCAKAFDGRADTKWYAPACDKCPGLSSNSVYYAEFKSAAPFIPGGIRLTTANDTKKYWGRSIRCLTIYGKLNESDEWVKLKSHVDCQLTRDAGASVILPINTPNRYRFFRVEITSVENGEDMQVAEIKVI